MYRVNVDSYKFLVEMGFSSCMATQALKQANNDINNALQVRQPMSFSVVESFGTTRKD